MIDTFDKALEHFATAVNTYVSVSAKLGIPMSRNDAIREAIADAKESVADAKSRRGRFAYETTREQFQEIYWLGAVAQDIEENYPRPSTGPMRDALIKRLG